MVLERTLVDLVHDVSACATLESLLCGKGKPKATKSRVRGRGNGTARSTGATCVALSKEEKPFDTCECVRTVVDACRNARKRLRERTPDQPLDNAVLCKLARFTDNAALAPYAPFLHFVPRLVNIVRRSHQCLGVTRSSHVLTHAHR
jgi:hypothetical protein